MPKRTSARLTKGKKRVRVDAEETYDDLEHGTDFELSESEQEEHKPPPRKRQHTATKPTKQIIRKKRVRGKQGLLADLVNMPVDIFAEIASHLLPGDIISLARSNKFFRNLLMHRSAMHIWHEAMRNVKGLPDCPPGMSEPHYLSLLFSKTCSMCGGAVRAEMDPMLLVRLCGSCRNASLTPLYPPTEFMHWLPYSKTTTPTKRRLSSVYALRADFNSLMEEWNERGLSKNSEALDKWKKDRTKMMSQRKKQAQVLSKFLSACALDRMQELDDMKAARLSEIKRRLEEMGWSNEDMKFDWRSANQSEWENLVWQPKPLTDRIWANIRPKLIPLLEANREKRLNLERDVRKHLRRSRLLELVLGIKSKSYLALEVKVQYPVPSASLPPISTSYQPPFPDPVSTLDWPILSELHETDATVAEMEDKFEKHREEIEALIADWASRAQAHCIGLLRNGPEIQGHILRSTAIVCDDGSDPFIDFSDDLKRLLRADSFFYKTRSFGSPMKEPLTYGSVFSSESSRESSFVQQLWGAPSRSSLNMDRICLHREAQEVARVILADMGRPDASYLEMTAVGANFVCGRCHDTDYMTWEQLIQHYVQQNEVCHCLQEILPSFNAAMVYNNVHDPELFTDRPLAKYFSVSDTDEDTDGWSIRSEVCKLCGSIPALREVSAFKPAMLQHLLDVHEITEPQAGQHYATKEMTMSDLFKMIYNGSGHSDDSGRCSCGCEDESDMEYDGLGYGYDEDDMDPGDLYDYDEELGYLYDDDEEEEDYGWW